MARSNLLLLLLLAAVTIVAVAEEAAHHRARRDFGCARGMIFVCMRRCARMYPGSTGYCQGFRCMCDTHIPIRRPPFIMG
uniref:Male-specific defensin n=1 Tax=Haemaphysalis longicornis TaxID=44386 RepID=F6LCB3_HAELO|nr:male-specific defensin [Haemaphysalis longicornis]